MSTRKASRGPASIEEVMRPEYRALLPLLTDRERASFEENVTPESMARIETWIGSRSEIEGILFWDRGGTFDDPAWQALGPVDAATGRLHEKARESCAAWRREAVESQLRSDLSLYSQFNDSLLFTGVAGAVRCDRAGAPDPRGEFFRGVDLRCIGSVEEEINTIRILPLADGTFEVSFDSSPGQASRGTPVHTGDSYALLQLEKLVSRDLSKAGWDAEVMDGAGKPVTLSPKDIRKAAHKGDPPPHGPEMTLRASTRAPDVDTALNAAAEGVRLFYERFGLETECYHIGKLYGNFFIARNDNFDDFLPGGAPSTHRGLVLFTATLVCRRCRREIPAFRNLARDYPGLTFALVNIASPQFKFYERVFADMGGGDARKFRDHAEGSTPFTIVYAADASGRLTFREYYGTEKAEDAPSEADIRRMLGRYFQDASFRTPATKKINI